MENKLQHTCATTREFTLPLLEHITNNFSEERIIGRGGYGVVYKGVLEDGQEIAVKKLHHMPGLDDKQFRNEFNNFMRAQHQNIVQLVGYCYDIGHQRIKHNGEYIFAHVEERLLCFEYLQGGSLDKHVSDESCRLDWPSCYKIIKGVCEGLNYLHNESKDPMYHLDLKPANILLDKDMTPKIGDFGLSRLFPSAHTYITTKIIGTRGYMPPEYIDTYQITPKFDVFSLGVIIIQIMAGRVGYSKCADIPSQEFIKLVHENWRKKMQPTMLSHTSQGVKTCIEIALRCVETDRVKRPTIAEIVNELNKIDTTIVDELNEFDNTKSSPIAQWRRLERKLGGLMHKVSDLRSKQAFNQYASSGGRLLPLPEKLSAKPLRGHVYSHYLRRRNLRWLLLLLSVVGWSITCFCYFGGIFDIEALVDKLLHQLAGKQSIMVNGCDTTNERPICMYGSNDTDGGMYHNSTLNFGDPSRRHEMHCRFMQSPQWLWLAITSSLGTLVIALLTGHIFHATVHPIAKVEGDFQNMMELKKRAEAADVSKSQFLATVSHGMRSPMNGVLGMLQMLMDTDLDTTQQDYVRTAQASGKALVSLINEVLDQARIESGKLELEAVPFDLRIVCDDILSLFCGKAQEKGLELAVYVSDQVPQTLLGDPGRMRQIITNLIGNSIKFTERGHIYLTVHVVEEVMSCLEVETGTQYMKTLSGYPVANRRSSWESFQLSNMELHSSEMPFTPITPDMIRLIISVEDTGAGIPFEAQSRIFTPFMQVGPSIARIHGGTGCGLRISKCLVNLMKGEIGFVSKPRVGSTFSFTAVLTRARSSGNVNKSSGFKGINALVVDHRPVRAKVTKYHLQRLGVQTELTTDVNQVIPKMNCGSLVAKLVLIDKETWLKESHSMPLLVSKLRNKDQSDSPKFFLLENRTSSIKSNSHIFREHNLNVIMKPLRASMLQVILRRALGGVDKVHDRNGVVGNSTLGSLLHKKQIIVVDDNVVNLKLAAGALKK